MRREYEEAFSEVDEILQLMPVELLIKIPLQFKKIISENKAKDYKPKIKEPVEDNQLKLETKVILGIIYRDFLASPEEREELQAKDAEELNRIEEEMKQQYDMDSIFKKRKKVEGECSTDLIEYKEQGFLKKLFNLIKGIFNRNKF